MASFHTSHVRRTALLLSVLLLAAVPFTACSDSGNGDTDGDGPVATDLRGGSSTIVYDTNSGIHASGLGTVSGEPDIAVISLGVEALRDTVSEARNDAARALAAIVEELRSAGVAEDDIRTARFSIDPRYEYVRDGQPQLLGFQVTNTLNVTLRNLDATGDIVDRAVTAGGDLTRVQSVSFRIEDTTALEEEARVLAIKDAVAKAELYADQLEVVRGPLVSISEGSFDTFPVAEARFAMAAMDSAGPPTQFFGGELEVSVRVQAVFAIE
ncbi:MAG: SIMPL domain-containing protein [Chloroflexota bacterium]|nr:SIMPL domain-containing protein [Chloroflexota bacterium]MDE2885720.1 SIMPL domain-containing protein [Chloroflexota bacterium]